MAKIKISSKVEQSEWEALQAIAYESNQSIAGLLSEAVADYVRKRRLRPEVLSHLRRLNKRKMKSWVIVLPK